MSTSSSSSPTTTSSDPACVAVDEVSHPRWETMWSQGLSPGQAFDILTPSPALVRCLEEGLVPAGRALVPGCGRGYDVTLLASEARSVLGLDIAESAVRAARERARQLAEGTYAPLAMEHINNNSNNNNKSNNNNNSNNNNDNNNNSNNNENNRYYRPQTSLAHLSQVSFRTDNFFSLCAAEEKDKFDFVYDYTFLCALHPSLREQWAQRMGELVRPGGALLTVVFPIVRDEEARGALEGPPYKVSLSLYRELLETQFECLELRELPPELCHPGRDGGADGKGFFSGVGRWRRK